MGRSPINHQQNSTCQGKSNLSSPSSWPGLLEATAPFPCVSSRNALGGARPSPGPHSSPRPPWDSCPSALAGFPDPVPVSSPCFSEGTAPARPKSSWWLSPGHAASVASHQRLRGERPRSWLLSLLLKTPSDLALTSLALTCIPYRNLLL